MSQYRPTITLLSILLLIGGISGASRAAEVAGVHFSEQLDIDSARLQLSGAGLLRYRVLFKGYAAALYLEEGASVDAALEDIPRRLEIEYFWPIPAEAFVTAMNEGIARNVDPRALQALGDRVAEMNRLYRPVRPGDRYAITYRPGLGTELSLNGEPVGVVEGDDFAAALFSIWLGDEPFDAGLKARLLGRTS